MTSVALARKWRPKSFAALVGQDHVTTALIHSLEQSRLHHAYLFTGTRGVGKTTIGRLFAKALNCEQGVSATPCLHCDACLAIDAGSYIDLIEIDAASNTRIEEIREILDNVPYAPTVGRYKVYLIDEVHMLSQHSFNALLKTLEEPPLHVKFLLATTDPQKLPATILSRCLQFYLRPISVSGIAQQLKFILKEEGLPYAEEEAIQLLAKSADGSMRDALSLLDQAIAAGQGVINLSILASQLNLMETHEVEQIIDALSARDVSRLLDISEQIARHGGNYEKVLQDLMTGFHQLALLQVLPSSSPLLENAEKLLKYRDAFQAEELQLMYQITLKGSQDILMAPTLAIGFEMTLLRLHTFAPINPVKMPQAVTQPEIAVLSSPGVEDVAKPSNLEPQPKETLEHTALDTTIYESIPIETEELAFSLFDDTLPMDEITPKVMPETQPSAKPDQKVNQNSTPSLDTDWQTIISHLKLTGIAQAAVDHASLIAFNAHELNLGISPSHRSLFTPAITKKIQQAIEDYYKINIRLTLSESDQATPAEDKLRQKEERRAKAFDILEKDSALNTIQQVFSAEIQKDSVELLKDDLYLHQ